MRTAILLCVALTGCATTIDPNFVLQMEAYRLTISSQREIDVAKAKADEARYLAMATIAERSDAQTKSMALFALALSGRGEASTRPVEVQLPQIPKTAEDRALQWAAVFSGPTTALVSSYFGFRLGQTQSNNQAATTQSSYAALVAMKPAPFTPLPTTDSHNIINTTTTTDTSAWITNRDGLVVVGGAQPTQGNQDNSPVTIVPPVFVPVVVTNP
jgi:hypothetical protein